MTYVPPNANGQATMANSSPVVIASNQTAIPITDNSGSLTVDGTVTVNAGTNLNTSALALETGGNLASVATNTTNIPNTIGTAASAIPSKLIQVGGSDGTNARALKTNTSGQLDVRPLTTSDAISATLSAETTKVIGTTRTLGNAGAIVDGVVTAASAPANGVMQLGIYNSTEPSPTTGQSVGIQLDSKGRQRGVIMDAAGNTRGANVDASNRLSVTVDNVSATNISTNIAQINGVTPLMGNGVTGTGSPRVTLASDGTAISTAGYMSVKIDQTTSGTTNGVVPIAGTAGGTSVSSAVSAASNNKTQAKGSAGQVYSISVQNISSAPVYLKMFDNTSAGVTAGTTACTYQFMCPANGTAANGAGIVHEFPVGINHATGITWMLTTGIGTTDNTSTAANIAIVTIGYK